MSLKRRPGTLGFFCLFVFILFYRSKLECCDTFLGSKIDGAVSLDEHWDMFGSELQLCDIRENSLPNAWSHQTLDM